MYNFLIDNAIKNVWCTPEQDKQLIIEPIKTSMFNGDLLATDIHYRRIMLPSPAFRFHVYQLGSMYSPMLGIPESLDAWTTLADACNSSKLQVDIYANSGLQLPRVHVWYMTTIDKNLILAVRTQSNINIDLNVEPLFLRVYSNAFFSSDRTDPVNDYIEVAGGDLKTTADIIDLQIRYQNSLLNPGVTHAFVNGYKVAGIDLISVKPGDVAEYVYDSSIYKVVDLKISDLQAFISELDTKNKYLIHYTDANDGDINYLDDIDFFIIEPTSAGRHIGVYYHKNMVDAVRMVTHKDYSLVVPYMVGYLGSKSDWNDITKLTVRMHIRKSGYHRPLILENNRIEELYKLPDDEVLRAMVGVNSTLHNWTASNLENSSYSKIMRSHYIDISRFLVQDAYGYNLISQLLGNTPKPVVINNGLGVSDLAYGHVTNSVGYEYDSGGMLLGWHQHEYGTEYIVDNIRAVQVEVITGLARPDLALDEVYGVNKLTLDTSAEYRFYKCPIINGQPTEAWVDVTGSSDYFIMNKVATWTLRTSDFYTMVRSNKNILSYDIDLIADNGLVNFSIIHRQTRNGVDSNWVMQVPMGELDIFLNGHSLIEGVDYIFNFPEVVIINKAYLQNVLNQPQKITVRYTGFCNSDFSSDVTPDAGFIKYGCLSRNNRFDIRDDKVLRIVVGGAFYNRTQLQFDESSTLVMAPNAINGVPYSIRDIVVPLRGSGFVDTYIARASSMAIDKGVIDYMNAFYPKNVPTGPNVIQTLYYVYSPFCCKILYDLKSGILNDPILLEQYNDLDVQNLCNNYKYLLKFDPTQEPNLVDSNYVQIQPHNLPNVVSLNIYQYKFLDRVVKLYMNGLVSLDSYVNIS